MLGVNDPDPWPNNLNEKLIPGLVDDGSVEILDAMAVSCCLAFEQDSVSPPLAMARQPRDTSNE
jgi:hypothetical protein